VNFFRRKRVNFFTLLLNQAQKVEEGMNALIVYMSDPNPLHGQTVLRLEVEADELRRRVIEELNQAFVTPIDREDINALSRAVDDIIDYGKSTVEEMMAFQLTPNRHMALMARGLGEASKAIAESISSLEDDKDKASERLVFAKKRENYVEHCYREALVDLFKESNVVTILKIREVYRHLSNAADKSDEAANIVGNILVKGL
jgi:uncharacterized protein Yka (UPF0111/DUF47 family)